MVPCIASLCSWFSFGIPFHNPNLQGSPASASAQQVAALSTAVAWAMSEAAPAVSLQLPQGANRPCSGALAGFSTHPDRH